MKKNIFILTFLCIFIVGLSACHTQLNNDTDSKNDYSFAVATDIHIFANSLYTPENIAYYETTDKMIHLSEPIFQTMADEIIEKKYDFLLLAGDLTEKGDETSHLAVASILNKIEKAGVEVYVIDGNHDVMNTIQKKDTAVSQSRFAEIYSDFGYGEADSRLDETLCYSVPIKNKFRLIAIDNMSYYIDETYSTKTDELSGTKIDWIDSQIEKSVEENLIPILLSHKSFLNHWPKIASVFSDPESTQIAEMACRDAITCGARLGFTGHDHFNDIKKYSYNDEDYYEVLTGSTCYLETNYRSVFYKNESISINTCTIKSIDTTYISSLISDEIYNSVKNDFVSYSNNHFDIKIKSTLYNYLDKLLRKFQIGEDDIDNFIKNDLIKKTLTMKIYSSESNPDISLEKIVKQYGASLPKTEYNTVIDVLASFIKKLVYGNENLRSSDEIIIGKYAFYSLLYCIENNKERIQSLCGQDITLNIDWEKLFQEGVLECYKSNLMPLLTSILKRSDKTKFVMAGSILKNNFNAISTLSDAISDMTDGIVNDIDKYFSSTEFFIDKFIEEGVFDNYLSDLLIDEAPDDREITITINRNNEKE